MEIIAKHVNGFSFKGEYDHGSATITEYTKEDEKTYDLIEFFKEFHGKTVSISIKEDNEPKPMKDQTEPLKESDGLSEDWAE
jgi:hypothetical protein